MSMLRRMPQFNPIIVNKCNFTSSTTRYFTSIQHKVHTRKFFKTLTYVNKKKFPLSHIMSMFI